jgi:hypothetical protein
MRSSSEWNEITAARPPSAEHLGQRREQPLELAELVVDRDAQGLEGARRGVGLAEARAARARGAPSGEVLRGLHGAPRSMARLIDRAMGRDARSSPYS